MRTLHNSAHTCISDKCKPVINTAHADAKRLSCGKKGATKLMASNTPVIKNTAPKEGPVIRQKTPQTGGGSMC